MEAKAPAAASMAELRTSALDSYHAQAAPSAAPSTPQTPAKPAKPALATGSVPAAVSETPTARERGEAKAAQEAAVARAAARASTAKDARRWLVGKSVQVMADGKVGLVKDFKEEANTYDVTLRGASASSAYAPAAIRPVSTVTANVIGAAKVPVRDAVMASSPSSASMVEATMIVRKQRFFHFFMPMAGVSYRLLAPPHLTARPTSQARLERRACLSQPPALCCPAPPNLLCCSPLHSIPRLPPPLTSTFHLHLPPPHLHLHLPPPHLHLHLPPPPHLSPYLLHLAPPRPFSPLRSPPPPPQRPAPPPPPPLPLCHPLPHPTPGSTL